MAGITATGLGSNLDVGSLVSQLMQVESQPLTKLDAKQGAVEVKISALGSFRGSLSSFQGTLKALAEPSTFKVLKGSVEETAVATLSATASADVGSYSLEVKNLAKAQKLASGAFSSVADPIGTGTISIQYGTYDAEAEPPSFTVNGERGSQSLQIDTAHMSLSGVRDAINAAKIGVSASIINDGTGYRLVMSAKDTGAANGLRISVTDADGNDTDAQGLSRLAYDPLAAEGAGKNMKQLIAAEDAELIVDGLEIRKASNTVTDVINGATINLLKTNAGSPTKLNIAADTSAATTAVDNFVKSYNELSKTIRDLTAYNAETRAAGALQGDSALRSIASDIRNGLSAFQAGAIGEYKALPQIGLTFDRNGDLKIDSGKLQDALKADPTAVQSLFSNAGRTDDPLVSYVGSSSASQAGNYALNITALAARGSATGSSAAGLTIDGTNDALSVKINGTSATVTLAQKTYDSVSELMAEVQSKINGSSALRSAGASVSLSEAGGVLTLSSAKYGSASTVAITGGNGAQNLFGATPSEVAGVDVAGTLSGSAATGSGQRLTGTGAAVGLKLDVLGGATGQRGSLQYGVGLAGQLDQMLDKLLDKNGLLASKTESLQGQVKQIEADRVRLNERLEVVRDRYTRQFNALDQQLSAMQSTSAYLAQQLAAIVGSGR